MTQVRPPGDRGGPVGLSGFFFFTKKTPVPPGARCGHPQQSPVPCVTGAPPRSTGTGDPHPVAFFFCVLTLWKALFHFFEGKFFFPQYKIIHIQEKRMETVKALLSRRQRPEVPLTRAT
jgi:hypothetical protein